MWRRRAGRGCECFRQTAGPRAAVSGVGSATRAGPCSLGGHGGSAATCSGGLAVLLSDRMGSKGGVRPFVFLNGLFRSDE